MADRPWKAHERSSAALVGGRRFPANQAVRRLSLAALERLAQEAERQGAPRGKVGLVIVKRRAGRGAPRPRSWW